MIVNKINDKIIRTIVFKDELISNGLKASELSKNTEKNNYFIKKLIETVYSTCKISYNKKNNIALYYIPYNKNKITLYTCEITSETNINDLYKTCEEIEKQIRTSELRK